MERQGEAGRPVGAVRAAVMAAAMAAEADHGSATWRELAERAQVGYAAAKQAVRDMLRAGDLEAVGHVKLAHSRRWMLLVAPSPRVARPAAQADYGAWAALQAAMGAWGK